MNAFGAPTEKSNQKSQAKVRLKNRRLVKSSLKSGASDFVGATSVHYRVDARDLREGLPPLSNHHDGRYYTAINRTGLVKTWHFWAHTLTTNGRWMAGATILFVSAGSISLDLQMFVPLCYAASMWTLALVALWIFQPRAALKARYAERVALGQTFSVDVEVTTQRALGRARIVAYRLPPWFEVEPESGALLPLLQAGETTRVALQLKCTRRGVWVLRGWSLESDAPFGLMQASQDFLHDTTLIVFPAFVPLRHLELPTGRSHHAGGVALANMRGESFEFWGNREWREGDNLRDIDWRATARLRRPLDRPVVREYREEWLLRVGVILDTCAYYPIDKIQKTKLNETSNGAFESAVSLAAAVGDYLAREDYVVDIFAAGDELHHLADGHSAAYLDQILDVLARVEATPDVDLSALGAEIAEYLGQVSTFVCILGDWNEERRELIRSLVEQGAAVRVVVVRDSPTSCDLTADSGWIGDAPLLTSSDVQRGVREI